jgi:hypothetical protein
MNVLLRMYNWLKFEVGRIGRVIGICPCHATCPLQKSELRKRTGVKGLSLKNIPYTKLVRFYKKEIKGWAGVGGLSAIYPSYNN